MKLAEMTYVELLELYIELLEQIIEQYNVKAPKSMIDNTKISQREVLDELKKRRHIN